MSGFEDRGPFSDKRVYCARWTAFTSLISGAPGFIMGGWYVTPVALILAGGLVGYFLQPRFLKDCARNELTKWPRFRAGLGMCLCALAAMPVFMALLMAASWVEPLGYLMRGGLGQDFDSPFSILMIMFYASLIFGIFIYPVALISGAWLQARWSRRFQPQIQIDAEVFS